MSIRAEFSPSGFAKKILEDTALTEEEKWQQVANLGHEGGEYKIIQSTEDKEPPNLEG